MLLTGYIKSIRYGLDTDLGRICDMYRSLENMRHESVRTLSDRDIYYIQGKLNRVIDDIESVQKAIDKITGDDKND